jgi:hypothetical protein
VTEVVEDGVVGIPDNPVVGEWTPVPGQLYDPDGMPLPVPPRRTVPEEDPDPEVES